MKPNFKNLPGGKSYQRNGIKLENEFYKKMPHNIKKNIIKNYIQTDINGDILVEYDYLYVDKINKKIIIFEIKGVNQKNSYNINYYNKVLTQANRQLTCSNLFNYKTSIIYCLITGNNQFLNPKLLKKLTSMNITIISGITPNHCVKNMIRLFSKII